MKRLAATLALMACGLAQPAWACSWPANLFEDRTGAASMVAGQFTLETTRERDMVVEEAEAAQEAEFALVSGTHHWSTVYTGVLVGTDGATYPLTFEIGVLERMCTPFLLPEESTGGTFYIEPRADGAFELIHWESEQ